MDNGESGKSETSRMKMGNALYWVTKEHCMWQNAGKRGKNGIDANRVEWNE